MNHSDLWSFRHRPRGMASGAAAPGLLGSSSSLAHVWGGWLVAALLGWLLTLSSVYADAIDADAALQAVLEEVALDLHGERWQPELAQKLAHQTALFGQALTSPQAQAWWQAPLPTSDETLPEEIAAAVALGEWQARVQHVAALEMLWQQQQSRLEKAREWRAIIKLPKYANAVEGGLALLRLGGDAAHQEQVSKLLAREYVIWQLTRAREKADALSRLAAEGRATPTLLAARATEIEGLAHFPAEVRRWALPEEGAFDDKEPRRSPGYAAVLAAARFAGTPEAFNQQAAEVLTSWRLQLESAYPNLLSEEDVQRREGLILKLLRLIPSEYLSGVKDGRIIIPLEYREAKSFTIQCQQIINELMPVWRETKVEAWQQHGAALLSALEQLESAIAHHQATPAEIEAQARAAAGLLHEHFGLQLKRAGAAADVVVEAALEIRSLLGQSLAAALDGQWRKAEALRLDAYVNFDLEIEARALPRDPALALAAEKAFLDGERGQPGIKALLDARASAEELQAGYERALAALEECVSLLKVGLSPKAAVIGAFLIVLREGLEAVVILAALLAGLRGPENASVRRRIGLGAWLALGVSALLFVASRYLLQGLTRYGETLEAIISIIAVIILLMVTNWVFHKYYWTGWNTKLRDLSKAALRQRGTNWENLALIGVGFTTIFREGFETTLFMQSLILESGLGPVLKGVALGGAVIGALGFGVFYLGAKMPYRKMLVYTGVLVVLVLFTFLGSTTRLFQTVGWLPVHPVPGLRLPAWVGTWLGLYPTWEGIIIPFSAFAYVAGAWVWVKISTRRKQAAALQAEPTKAAPASVSLGAGS